MTIETTPSSMPDPEWERLVGGFFSGPANAPEAAPIVKQTAVADPMGDTPLTPAWTKTRAGWKARARIGRVNSARGFRRWLRRQATEHGHAAQTWRGITRTAHWVHGIEGVHVLAARHEVQQAQRDYKSAKWAHDKRLIPGTEKDKRRKDMEAAFAESSKALAGYKKARAEARTKRAIRGAAALAPVAAVEGAGIHLLGAPGGLMATGATLAALALLGRRTAAGELYTDRDAKIGDGDRMTDDMVNRVYRSAKVIGTDDVVKLLSPCTLTADGAAWEVRLELPDGIPASKALGATPQLANGFGVSVQQVSQTKGEREDWLTLRVTLKVPFTGKPHKGPLLAAEKVNLWAPVPMAISERGDVMAVDWFEKTALFGGEPGAGKALALDTPVPTPSGWTTMGEIEAGDVVYDETGKPCTVTEAWDVRHGRPCYEIEFSDGSVIVADADHQWLVDTRASRLSSWRQALHRTPDSPFSRKQQHKRAIPQVLTTADMVNSVRIQASQRLNYSVRNALPLDGPTSDLPVAPYTLGAWLGDGTSAGAGFTTADPEVLDQIRLDGYEVKTHQAKMHYAISTGVNYRKDPAGTFTGALRAAGVLGNKHIPNEYLRASEAQRRALLAGLLDTDGSCSKNGSAEFYNTNERLARGVYHLVCTLGYKATLRRRTARLNGKDCGIVWTVAFTPSHKVFRLPRKLERQVTKARSGWDHRYVVDIRPCPSVPVRCIAVDSPTHLFLVGDSCIPTHNSASANNPLLAASLDVTADFYLADGKGGFDLTPFEPIAQMIDTDGDPKKLLAILTHVWEVVLPELKQTVKDHSVRKFSESLAAKDKRVRFTILYIDEWASYMAAASPEQQKELERLLRLITQQGRAYAVIVIAATQKPDSNAVPTGIRDILSTRWAGRCMTPEASDTILGKGRATAGYNAQRILKSQRGVGYLQTGETSEPVLTQSYFYTDDEVETILRRAYELRQRAGVLPAAAEPGILDHLLKAAASTGRGNVTRAEVFAHLATVDGEFVQGADEGDVRYASRAGSALKDRLAVLGVDVPAVQFPLDGKRVWGWTVEALQRAR
ncbi:LAGLIDADG family homing endonuclease [Streptomyces sp. NPDC001268]|uniref:LAGLIDADG family homing endonuclease n=1 Tax=Streptomyces sp. NPDC001268 TaxID=3364553 RepID=UPI0036836EE7